MTYLDHAATTPVLPEVIDAITEAMGQVGNPSSLHASGRRARRRIEESRESIAASLGARPSEVVFTAGGTEADNLALKGIYWARNATVARRSLVTSSIEHHAVLDTVDWLQQHEHASPTLLPVDRYARVAPASLAEVLDESTALVSVMWANNEVGTVAPIAELAAIAHEHGVPLHTDAVQAVGTLPVDFAASGADALTLTGHKLGGPVGVGALLLRRDVDCVPLQHGGGQERDVRSGTLDVAGTVGLALAVRLAVTRREAEAVRVSALRDQLIAGMLAAVPDARVNGHPTECLPGIANLTFPDCEGDALLMLLDGHGVECSTGSACSAGVAQPSHVLLALGADAGQARGSLRFSLGHTSTAADVEAAVAAIVPSVERARSAGMTSVSA